MKLETYRAYFEGLASQYIPISHSEDNQRFARIDIEEVILGLRSRLDLNNPCLILEVFEGQLENNQNDYNPNNQAGAFYMVQNAIPGDFAHEVQVLDECLQYGQELISKMFLDSRRKIGPFQSFNLDKVTYNKVGPLFDNAYGFRFEFHWHDQFKAVLTPANWNL